MKKSISWKWLGFFILGILAWILGKGVLAAFSTNFLVKKLNAGDYVFAIYALLSMLFVTILFYFLYRKIHPEGFKIFRLNAEHLKKDALIGIGFAVLLAAISIFIIIPLAGPENKTIVEAQKLVHTLPFINIVTAGIFLGGFSEELFFRGHIITSISMISLKSRYLVILAVTVSAILFGLGHEYQGLLGTLFSGLTSIIFALLYIKRKSLVSPMIAHALYDTLVAIAIKYFIEF